MRDSTFRKFLLIALVCTLALALVGVLLMEMGYEICIAAVIAGTVAAMTICAELIRSDRRNRKEKEDGKTDETDH